jgi:hypothetical protein
MKILDKSRKKSKEKPDYEIQMEERKKQYELEYLEEKLKWEEKNELAKKHDACNLGMTHTAFHGTYEEYLEKQRARTNSALFNQQSLLAQMSQSSLTSYYSGQRTSYKR